MTSNKHVWIRLRSLPDSAEYLLEVGESDSFAQQPASDSILRQNIANPLDGFFNDDSSDESEKKLKQLRELNIWKHEFGKKEEWLSKAQFIGLKLFNLLFDYSNTYDLRTYIVKKVRDELHGRPSSRNSTLDISVLSHRIVFVFDVEDELQSLPWELFFIPLTKKDDDEQDTGKLRSGVFLSAEFPLVRYVADDRQTIPSAQQTAERKTWSLIGCHESPVLWPCCKSALNLPEGTVSWVRHKEIVSPREERPIIAQKQSVFSRLFSTFKRQRSDDAFTPIGEKIYVHLGHGFTDPEKETCGLLLAEEHETPWKVTSWNADVCAQELGASKYIGAILAGSLTCGVSGRFQPFKSTLPGQLLEKLDWVVGLQHEASSSSCVLLLKHLMDSTTNMDGNRIEVGLEVLLLHARRKMLEWSVNSSTERKFRRYPEGARIPCEWWKPVIYARSVSRLLRCAPRSEFAGPSSSTPVNNSRAFA